VEYPATVIARTSQEGELLVDSISSQPFQRILLDLISEGRTLAGRSGRLVSTKSAHLAEILKDGPTAAKPVP